MTHLSNKNQQHRCLTPTRSSKVPYLVIRKPSFIYDVLNITCPSPRGFVYILVQYREVDNIIDIQETHVS